MMATKIALDSVSSKLLEVVAEPVVGNDFLARLGMNEQNPPPEHVARAEYFQKVQLGILLGCLVILVYLLVALDSANLLFLLMVLVFMALPLTAAFFIVGRKIRYWEKPYQLYSREFSYKPKLKSGMQVPIEVEYQFPTPVTSAGVLDQIHAAADEGLGRSFATRSAATDYEETRRLMVEVLAPEIERYGIEVFRIHIAKIQLPSSQYQSVATLFSAETSSLDAPRSLAAKAN
jgi:hypothetical protein